MSTNTTYVPCTLQTCPLSTGIITYQPNIGANASFLALFGLMLVVQFVLGFRCKTWSFLVAMAFGLVLEVVGYVGRIQLHDDPFSFTFFIEYLVCLTIAPAFICAAIYITFRRVVHSCDDTLSYFRPKLVSVFFMTMDFICLVLQAAGGAITSTSGGTSEEATAMREAGVNIMIAGLALQVVSLVLFISYASMYAWKWCVAVSLRGRQPVTVHGALKKWNGLAFGLAIASITVLIRSAFRVAELREGFQSGIASDEVLFMILEGGMLLFACLALTIPHPGLCLGIPWKITKAPPSLSESFQHVQECIKRDDHGGNTDMQPSQ